MNQNEIIAIAQTALALYKNGYQPGEDQFEAAVEALTEGLSKSSGEELDRDTANYLLVLAYYSMMLVGEMIYGQIEETTLSSDEPCEESKETE